MFGSQKIVLMQQYPKHPFLSSVDDIARHLQTNIDTGLSPLRVQDAQRTYGPNKLSSDGGIRWYSVLLKQVSNAMILVSLFLPESTRALSSIQYTPPHGIGEA